MALEKENKTKQKLPDINCRDVTVLVMTDHNDVHDNYPLVMTNSLLLNMAIEIVSFSMKRGDLNILKQ